MKTYRKLQAAFISVFFAFCRTRSEENHRTVEKTIEKLLKGYDKRIVPYEKGKPVECDVRLLILNLADMKPINSHITMELLIHKSWIDHRLKVNENSSEEAFSIIADSVDMIWVPDLVITSEKSGEISTVTRKNIYAKISSNGHVTLGQRYLMTIYCQMQYFLYPFDRQTCNVTICSYAYSRTWMRLQWSNLNRMEAHPNANAGKFFLLSYKTSNITIEYSEYGTYDGLQLTLKLRRKAMPYVLRIYIPLVVIVIMSWSCFWINYRSVPARTSVSVCLVLTMIMFITSTQSRLPRIGALRMVDVHMFICFTYVYAVLIEYAVVQSIDVRVKNMEFKDHKSARGKADQEMKSKEICNDNDIIQSSNEQEGPDTNNKEITVNKNSDIMVMNDGKKKNRDYNPLSMLMQKLVDLHRIHQDDYHILDRISKVAFPCTFIVYTLFYVTFVILTREN